MNYCITILEFFKKWGNSDLSELLKNKIIMARRRYYRVKKVYPKQKWLPVNNEVALASVDTLNLGAYVVTVQPITENPTRNTTSGEGNVTSATILKVGRFKLKGIISGPNTNNSQTSYIIGVAYIPEGYSVDQSIQVNATLGTTFFYRHPEWIICWTRMDFISNSQGNEFSLSSRLKRNLNSGDQIVVFRIAINASTAAQSASPIRATISYVCRAN